MTRGPRIDNELLLQAGLDLMKQNGKPLSKRFSAGRSMMYDLESGETVRVRTCNDHILIVLGDKPSGDAKLNIEGTDWLLIVMPEIERTPGKVIAYLVPTKVAADAARQTHNDWLATEPNTKGSNTTWNLWFREDGPQKANDFARKWSAYRLAGNSDTTQPVVATPSASNSKPTVGPLTMAEAKKGLALTFNVPPEAIEITIRG